MKRMIAILGAGCAAVALSACETIAEETQPTLNARMNGAAEVPGPGDPDGTGHAEVSIADALNSICYEIDVLGLDNVTAAHIHRGAAGVAGPPVVTLDPPTDGDSKECEGIDGGLADEIRQNPTAFYVNIHTSAYPDGAIRGQLTHD
jgi:hypothetical protein